MTLHSFFKVPVVFVIHNRVKNIEALLMNVITLTRNNGRRTDV